MNYTIRVAKTKALISVAVTAKLICACVFAYANCWFSHAQAQISLFDGSKENTNMRPTKHSCSHMYNSLFREYLSSFSPFVLQEHF